MKKIVSLFLILAVVATLCSCNLQELAGKTENGSADTSVSTSTPCADMTATSSTQATTGVPTKFIEGAELKGISKGVSKTLDGKGYKIYNNEWETIEVQEGFFWDENIYEPYTAVVTSEDGITDLMRKYCSAAEDVFTQFDEAFFEENALVFYGASSGSSTGGVDAISVGEIIKGESIEIMYGRPYLGPNAAITADMVSFTYILIVDKNAINGAEKIKITPYFTNYD